MEVKLFLLNVLMLDNKNNILLLINMNLKIIFINKIKNTLSNIIDIKLNIFIDIY